MAKLRALVAAGIDEWRAAFTKELLDSGCDIHMTSSAAEAIDLVRKHRYHVAVIDEKLLDGGEVELVLNLRDLWSGEPVVLLSGSHVARRRRVWERCGVFFAGSRIRTLRKLAEAVETARARGGLRAPGNKKKPKSGYEGKKRINV